MENKSYNPSFHPVNKSVSHANTEIKQQNKDSLICFFLIEIRRYTRGKEETIYLNSYSSENNCFVCIWVNVCASLPIMMVH